MFDNNDENEAVEADPPGVDDLPEDPSLDDLDEPEDAQDGVQPASGDPDLGPGGPEDPSRGSNDVEVEEALKELSARMSRISSNLEGFESSRGDLEDKLGNVEERLSNLGSLAEAVSSEYNPFISGNEPDQPSWDPGEAPGNEPPDPQAQPEREPPSQSDPETGSEPQGETPPAGGENDQGIPSPDPREIRPDEGASQQPGPDPLANPQEARSRRPEPGGLEENMILLEWVGMMLDRVGRAGLMDLLDYYQNLGWLDRETKDQAMRVAVGVDAPDTVEDGEWRGDLDMHRRSLVAIQRLRGDEIPAARLDELDLDLRRLFRE